MSDGVVFFLIITDIDECQRPGVCGLGAICVNLPGSHECRCPNGTTPEPDARTKCVSLLRCALDDDCPGNSICDPTKECLCPEPNVGKDCRRKTYYIHCPRFFFLSCLSRECFCFLYSLPPNQFFLLLILECLERVESFSTQVV